MPTSTQTSRRPPATDPIAADVIEATRQATDTATDTYFAGLDAAVAVQRSLAAGTPLAPVADILDAQVSLTREVLKGFARPPAAARPGGTSPASGTSPAGGTSPASRTAPAGGASAAARARAPRRSTAARSAAKRATAANRTPAAPRTTRAAGAGRARRPASRPDAAKAKPPAQPATPPLADYDTLTAEQLVARLPELSQRTLAEVRAYEQAHAARATVLERIDALAGDEPLPGYDELGVEDIVPRLADGGPAVAARVLEYERRHRERAGVLDAAQRHLPSS